MKYTRTQLAGALFDFLCRLTTRPPLSAMNAAIFMEMLQEWADERGFSLDGADVEKWTEGCKKTTIGMNEVTIDIEASMLLKEIARKTLAKDLISRMREDKTVGSVGCWITADGQDVWVQATHECHTEQDHKLFEDDTDYDAAGRVAGKVDPNQGLPDLDTKDLHSSEK